MKFLTPLCFLVVLAGCDSSSETAVLDDPVSFTDSDNSFAPVNSDSFALTDSSTSTRTVCTGNAVDSGDGWGFEDGA